MTEPDTTCRECGRPFYDNKLLGGFCSEGCRAKFEMRKSQQKADLEQANLIAEERARRKAEEKERKRQEKILAKATTRVNELKEELLELKNRIPLLQNAIDTRDFVSIKKLSKDKKKKGSGCLTWIIYIFIGLLFWGFIMGIVGSKSKQANTNDQIETTTGETNP